MGMYEHDHEANGCEMRERTEIERLWAGEVSDEARAKAAAMNEDGRREGDPERYRVPLDTSDE